MGDFIWEEKFAINIISVQDITGWCLYIAIKVICIM